MNLPHFSRCLTRGTYHASRVVVVAVSCLVILALAAFLYLRIHGVPGPVLRAVVRRANAAGIPVEVDRITLTLNGWRADNVRYYSMHPDDLKPLFRSDHLFFSVRNSKAPDAASNDWNVDVEAEGIDMVPSVTWGVEIPPGSACLHAEHLGASLGFRSDRVVLSNGKMQWLGSRFAVNGTILKGEREQKKPPAPPQRTILPVFVDARRFQALEKQLAALSLPRGATVDIDFRLDMADYSASRVAFSCKAEAPSVHGISFSGAELSGSYTYPELRIDRAGVALGDEECWLEGTYAFDSKKAVGTLANTIVEKGMLRLFPEKVGGALAKIGLRMDELPQLKIAFGPTPPGELRNHFAGTFSIHGAAYKDLGIETLAGRIKRENNRFDLSELDGVVAGQESRADETGSAMHGGFARGSCFWDGDRREFGVDVDACLDPNILVGVLSPIRIATNIIERFSFKDQPPVGHVAVGMVIPDRDSFYIDIAGKGTNALFQGVAFDSIDVVQTYRHGKVKLDPLAAMQGTASTKGSVLLDFHHSTATFDIASGMKPADIEDLVYPKLKLFEKHIGVEGNVHTEAKGVFDWKSMQKTDFLATIRADRVGLPVAELDRFSAKVRGTGPVVAVEDAAFGLYGGKGEGKLSFAWNPGKKNLPYETSFTFSNVDFHRFLVFLGADHSSTLSGKLGGNAHIRADFSTNFYAAAQGEGFVRVEDGQLADLPLFSGFSRVVRMVIPSFTVFSITGLRGSFTIADGAVSSSDAYFEGDLISAKGEGSYRFPTGFDATVQVQMLRDSYLSKVVRAITDPLLKLFEMRLTGTLSNPSWKLKNF